jgi:hypothetical protein
MEKDDERCCGTGHCMIDTAGRCWCGQQWDGEKMCMTKSNANDEHAAITEKNTENSVTSAYIASDNKPA